MVVAIVRHLVFALLAAAWAGTGVAILMALPDPERGRSWSVWANWHEEALTFAAVSFAVATAVIVAWLRSGHR